MTALPALVPVDLAELVVSIEPAGGCPTAVGGAEREYVFGAVSDLELIGAEVALSGVRCVEAGLGTTSEVLTSEDPDLDPEAARYYLWRFVGDPDFGTGLLVDGFAAPRVTFEPIACP